MRLYRRVFVIVAVLWSWLLLSSMRPILAQAPVDPSGHWDGIVQLPAMTLHIAFDLTKNAKGELEGTWSQPDQKISGLPVSAIAVENRTVTFTLAVTGSTFRGTVDADGVSMSGEVESRVVGTVPAAFVRKGDARIEAAPRNAAIGKELEGTWNGRLDTDGGLRIVLKLANQPDGTATATMISLDQGGLELPLGITQKGASVTLDVKMVGSSYAGDLNSAGTELTGTFTTAQGVALPLNFRRAGH